MKIQNQNAFMDYNYLITYQFSTPSYSSLIKIEIQILNKIEKKNYQENCYIFIFL